MRFGEKIYYRNKLDKPQGIIEYSAPQEVTLQPNRCSVMPASGYTATQEFGANKKDYQTAIFQPYQKWKGVFKEKDIFYIEGATPLDEENDGECANYVVDNVAEQNEVVRLTLKRI